MAGLKPRPTTADFAPGAPKLRVGSAVLEGGTDTSGRPGVMFVRRDGDTAVSRIESGRYVFESRW